MANNGHRAESVTRQAQVDIDGLTHAQVLLDDCPQSTLAEIERDPVGSLHTANGKVADGERHAEQRPRMPPPLAAGGGAGARAEW